MHLQITFSNALMFASLAYASGTRPSLPAENAALTTSVTIPASDNMIFETGTDYFIPDFMLDKEIALTPEESQLRRVNLGKIFARLSRSSPDKIRKLSPFKYQETGTLMPSMIPDTGVQNLNTQVTSDSIAAPDSDRVEDTDVDYSADGEGSTDLDTSPEETELRRGGRGGHGRGGRGRGRFGRGRGRFGRGRFGRGGRFGRFGGRRFGRFGRFSGWGSGWNDDCGGDDCGDC
ncbi:hypothetical protein K7432_018648 [Basidiobolus ranarum]|uniref:Uncharacterized protein n=1 Tax=Basidiobolus ranarum TaxID=34480 RepID=A0ABR2WL77_9FUNG